jgi:hypothetical protein
MFEQTHVEVLSEYLLVPGPKIVLTCASRKSLVMVMQLRPNRLLPRLRLHRSCSYIQYH